MSESKKIAEHDDALAFYFDEMLAESEPTADNVTNTNKVASTQPEPVQQASFQVLLFDINGLQLAIRTNAVKAILPWPETPLVQDKSTAVNEAIIGVYNQASSPIKVINTAYIVLPIQHRQDLNMPSFMIVFEEGHWALSCHKINAVITLSTDDVNWRKNRTIRPWLAGTSIKQGCSIIDPTGLINLLDSRILA